MAAKHWDTMNHPTAIMHHQRKKIIGENTYRILMKESKVKVVVGPEGRHIKDIYEHCIDACKITIYTQHADGTPFTPGSPDRIMNVECSPEDLEVVFVELIPHLQAASPDLMAEKFNEIRVVVPEFVCNTIIGKKGVNVKSINKDLHSFVRVHQDPLPLSTERVVTLKNKDVNLLAASVVRVYDSIRLVKCISHVTMFNPLQWNVGEYGDTGSFIEEVAYKSQSSTSHEPMLYYREAPRPVYLQHRYPRPTQQYSNTASERSSSYHRQNDRNQEQQGSYHIQNDGNQEQQGSYQKQRGGKHKQQASYHRQQDQDSYNRQNQKASYYRQNDSNQEQQGSYHRQQDGKHKQQASYHRQQDQDSYHRQNQKASYYRQNDGNQEHQGSYHRQQDQDSYHRQNQKGSYYRHQGNQEQQGNNQKQQGSNQGQQGSNQGQQDSEHGQQGSGHGQQYKSNIPRKPKNNRNRRNDN